MAKPAAVLHQAGGTGVIVFDGQEIPAAAIRADALKHLHELARLTVERVQVGDTTSGEFRDALQEVHLEIAALLLSLQDTALRHGFRLPPELHVRSDPFVYLDGQRPR